MQGRNTDAWQIGMRQKAVADAAAFSLRKCSSFLYENVHRFFTKMLILYRIKYSVKIALGQQIGAVNKTNKK